MESSFVQLMMRSALLLKMRKFRKARPLLIEAWNMARNFTVSKLTPEAEVRLLRGLIVCELEILGTVNKEYNARLKELTQGVKP